jgi:hypothetical protein
MVDRRISGNDQPVSMTLVEVINKENDYLNAGVMGGEPALNLVKNGSTPEQRLKRLGCVIRSVTGGHPTTGHEGDLERGRDCLAHMPADANSVKILVWPYDHVDFIFLLSADNIAYN